MTDDSIEVVGFDDQQSFDVGLTDWERKMALLEKAGIQFLDGPFSCMTPRCPEPGQWLTASNLHVCYQHALKIAAMKEAAKP